MNQLLEELIAKAIKDKLYYDWQAEHSELFEAITNRAIDLIALEARLRQSALDDYKQGGVIGGIGRMETVGRSAMNQQVDDLIAKAIMDSETKPLKELIREVAEAAFELGYEVRKEEE